MDNSKNLPDLTFRKPVGAIVLMPTKGALRPLSRKLFNSILHKTQLQAVEAINSGKTYSGEEYFEGHTFSAPLKDLLRPFSQSVEGATQEVRERNMVTEAKMCFTEMRRAESNWLSPDEQAEVLFSSLSLLSQAQIVKVKGELQARWAFPPEIMKLLIKSKLYTPLDNEQIGKLKTYAAIALYEICVRYKFKGKAEAYTSTHDLEFWVDALTASPKIDPKTGRPKLRPWAKFKYDQGNKAIQEINEKSNIFIELIEHKGVGKTVVSAQFKVTHKDVEAQAIPAIAVKKMSPELAAMAVRAGVDTSIVSVFIRDGQSEVGLMAALEKLASRNPDLKPIDNVASYLSKILDDVNGLIDYSSQASNQATQTLLPATSRANAGPLPLAMSFKDERRAEIRAELLSLELDAQKVYAYLALAELRKSKLARASTTEKVEAGKWIQDPFLLARMVDVYATEKFGPDWGKDTSQA